MISSETPYKLAEIIRDTWPQLYRPVKVPYNNKKTQKMKKYNSEDYFSVIEIKTGRKIVDCGEEADALAIVAFDPQNRTITRNKFMMGPVVDIEIQKALPTADIISVHNFETEKFDDYLDNLIEPRQTKLPEGEGKPVKIF